MKYATLQLCNFSTIHSHGSILDSFESQEPQLSFSRHKFAFYASVATRQLQPPDRCVRLPARNELREEKKLIFSQFDQSLPHEISSKLPFAKV